MMALAGIALAGLACASSPPSELRDARTAYRDAAASPAVIEAPDELGEAELALQHAEDAFDEHGDEATTRNKALVAKHKADIAVELAEQRIAIRQEQVATELAQPADLPVVEAPPRVQAEMDGDALRAIRDFATLSQDEDGLLISLSADAAFASGSAEISPAMQDKLLVVAKALEAQSENRIIVTGYADSIGSDASNRALSLDRASAVRNVLVAAGLPESRFNVVGRGEEAPVASNATAEGRAQNRRVEIRLGTPSGDVLPESPFDMEPPE
jgi:outer membrane protein OmpA-like peptidoglycan-associated protein